jgi:hypothetical protein
MSVTTNSLRDLHHLHRQLDELRRRLDAGPRQLEARRRHLAQRTEALETARADVKNIKVQAHHKETERKSLDARISQLQLQINTAKSNKEYAALVHEKETVVKARVVLEDELLDFMLREEEKTQTIPTAEKELQRVQQELAELERTVEAERSELTSQLAATESQLRATEQILPHDMQEAYQRLMTRRGPDGLAEVRDDVCTGCYTGITPQMFNQLLLNELVLCKSCGRILYLEDSAMPAKVQ